MVCSIEVYPFWIPQDSAEASVNLEDQAIYNNLFFQENDVYWEPSSNCTELYAQLSKFKFREIWRHQVRYAVVGCACIIVATCMVGKCV